MIYVNNFNELKAIINTLQEAECVEIKTSLSEKILRLAVTPITKYHLLDDCEVQIIAMLLQSEDIEKDRFISMLTEFGIDTSKHKSLIDPKTAIFKIHTQLNPNKNLGSLLPNIISRAKIKNYIIVFEYLDIPCIVTPQSEFSVTLNRYSRIEIMEEIYSIMQTQKKC